MSQTARWSTLRTRETPGASLPNTALARTKGFPYEEG
jgi:hypothetical protein